jgi:glutamine---fructose-6-phosphate transaminase (isomerizing)
VLAILALKAARRPRPHGAAKLAENGSARLRTLPGQITGALTATRRSATSRAASPRRLRILFLGRGAMYPLALEGALKLKEISYIHAEGYASGELKHGPIALIDETMPVVVMAPTTASSTRPCRTCRRSWPARAASSSSPTAPAPTEAGDGTWKRVVMPTVPEFLAPILYAIPAQLLAYHAAVAKGTDVDQPRNLAKSVTVE